MQKTRQTEDICKRLGVTASSHAAERGNYKANRQRSKVKNQFGNQEPQIDGKYMHTGSKTIREEEMD